MFHIVCDACDNPDLILTQIADSLAAVGFVCATANEVGIPTDTTEDVFIGLKIRDSDDFADLEALLIETQHADRKSMSI